MLFIKQIIANPSVPHAHFGYSLEVGISAIKKSLSLAIANKL